MSVCIGNWGSQSNSMRRTAHPQVQRVWVTWCHGFALVMLAMKTLLIVFHSFTGGTRQMAEAATRGAGAEAEVDVRLLQAPDAGPADVLAADGYIFATPENLAALAGLMKDFFDRTYYAALDQINGRPYAVLICAGSDGQNAARQIEHIATGWRLRAVADPIIVCTHAQTPKTILAPKRIGSADLARARRSARRSSRASRRGSIDTGRCYAGVQLTAGNGRNPAVPSTQTLRIQPRVPKTPHRYSAVLDRRP